MSASDPEESVPETDPDADIDGDSTAAEQTREAQAELERLRVENERLRREYDRSRKVEYGRTAVGLAVVGVAALVGAIAFPVVREVLLIVGSIGLFAAVLTRFLMPEQFLPIDVAEGVYNGVAESRRGLIGELGLTGDPAYISTEEGSIRLFVPQYDETPLPDPEDVRSAFVVSERDGQRGVTFTPTGAALFREFKRTLQEPLADRPSEVAFQLSEGLSGGLELVDPGDIDVEAATTSVTVELSDPPFGDASRIDHPLVSFVGVGLATALKASVTVADIRVDDDRATVTYTWETETVASGPTETGEE